MALPSMSCRVWNALQAIIIIRLSVFIFGDAKDE